MVLHRNNKSAILFKDIGIYYKSGQLHRTDGSVYVKNGNHQFQYKYYIESNIAELLAINGNIHRDSDLPAITLVDSTNMVKFIEKIINHLSNMRMVTTTRIEFLPRQ